MEHMRKHLYWDIYGVRTFPYRGRRKYFPCIYQDYDGTIMIRNDVFGLTIAQFERDFKALLVRRKENEPEIQNIRFPDKTSTQYMEYLERGDDTVQGSVKFRELLDEDRYFRCLVQMAGTEHDIRIRERMFILIDNINNKLNSTIIQISSGSLAEGIDLPGSDVDIMYVISDITVTDGIEHLHLSTHNTTLLMEYDVDHPGFCELKLVLEGFYPQHVVDSLVKTEDGLYLSTEKFLQIFLHQHCFKSYSTHGPCISDANQAVDYAICLRIKYWPISASHWCNRHRKSQWPTCTVIDSILEEGCLLVPIAPRNSEKKLLWRISFSMAEKRLIHSMNYTQLLCYILLKLTLKNIINRHEEVKDLLCSYFLKTTVFWLSEEISINTFKISELSHCYFLCIDKLISFVRKCCCPNYFIPEHNMFIGKINECNSKPLLNILRELKNMEFSVIMECIFSSLLTNEELSTPLLYKELSMNLELLLYRVTIAYVGGHNIEKSCKVLRYIKSVMKTESSEFLLDVLCYYYAIIAQDIPQMLVLTNSRHKRYTTIRLCHKYLMEGTKADSVNGFLLNASFHYVLGDYKTTLKIVDNVLSRCTPDMIMLKLNYTTDDKKTYRHKTEPFLTLNQKMRQATLDNVCYLKQSTLVPQELQLEVQNGSLYVPPVVMSQCLQFLCYHHLGDVNNKHRTLRELSLTIKESYFIYRSYLSESLVILGVCNELSGDKQTAYQCYHNALHCKYQVCQSAEKRLNNLFLT